MGPSATTSELADLVIRGGTVVLPGDGTYELDVVINDGIIHSLDRHGQREGERELEADGLHVLPGLVDPHVHLDVYHPPEDELQHETRSALRGGVTTLGAMCWSEEGDSLSDTAQMWESLVPDHSWTDFFPHLVVSEPQHLTQIEEMAKQRGITSFKLYVAGIEGFFGNVSDGFLLRAAREIERLGPAARMLVHCENQTINDTETERFREQSPEQLTLEQWRQARPDFGEAEAIHRVGVVARETGVPLYLVHVSSADGLQAALSVKHRHNPTYVETLCDFLSVTTETARGPLAKQVPPLRDQNSVDALWEGVRKEWVDTLATDHVTLTREEKNEQTDNLWEINPSYQKVEFHLPVLLEYGYHQRDVPLERLVDAASRRPAHIFGLYPRKGTLLPGSDADLTLVDLSLEKTVNGTQSLSIGDFSMWDGEPLRGWPITTVKGGEIVIQEGETNSKEPQGRFLTRELSYT